MGFHSLIFMDIVFMGTPLFATKSLEALIHNYGVQAVFTQPDRPSGRGNKIKISPVKEVALKNNIPIWQPEKINKDKDAIEYLKNLRPDFIVVVAYGQILSKEILDIPKFGCINVHASLLPKFRGASPINFAILNGEKYSGITTILMNEGMDTGDIFLKKEINIEGLDYGKLYDKLMVLGAEVLIDTIFKIVNNNITPLNQNEEEASYCALITKDITKIDWNESGDNIINKIRAFSPTPGAFTTYRGKSIKIFEALFERGNYEIGKISEIDKEFIRVGCKDGSIKIFNIKMQDKKQMEVKEFLKGNKLELNEKLL